MMKKEHLTFLWPENNGTVSCGHHGTTDRHDIYRVYGTDDWQLLATTAGRGRIGCINGMIEVSPRDIILMRSGVLHDYCPAEPGWEYDWVHFRPRQKWLDLLAWPEDAPGLMRLGLTDVELRDNGMSALARPL
jgi:AraC family transcriptional regulator of arabinose operon